MTPATLMEGGSPGSKSKERPILFRGEMMRAILAGRKTQTRRVLKPQPPACGDAEYEKYCSIHGALPVACPYGKPGDRLWVRETFRLEDFESIGDGRFSAAVIFRADGAPHQWRRMEGGAELMNERLGWRSSIHMPRWACRIVLAVTGVRVERLQDISEEDAEAEGALADRRRLEASGATLTDVVPSAQRAFRRLWESIHGEESWRSNPWLWVITFKRAEGVFDEVPSLGSGQRGRSFGEAAASRGPRRGR